MTYSSGKPQAQGPGFGCSEYVDLVQAQEWVPQTCVTQPRCCALSFFLLLGFIEGSTKSALDMLTKVMALELGPHKVRPSLCKREGKVHALRWGGSEQVDTVSLRAVQLPNVLLLVTDPGEQREPHCGHD